MSYLDRLQPEIKFTSPSGIEFSAKWIGGNVSFEKELGIFKTPGIKGVISQDLDIRGVLWPLTFFFDGPDNDIDSTNFVEACKENGKWSIIHPVKGVKTLQLVSISESVQPVTSGNITQITSEWIEVIDKAGTKSAAQLAGETISKSVELDSATADQLNEVTDLDTADKVGKFKTAVDNVVSSFDSFLKPITETIAEVQAQADSIKRGIDSVLQEPVIDVLSIAGQIQALVDLPNLVVTDLNSKLDSYSKFAESILQFSPDSATPAGINTAAVQEIAATSALRSASIASATTDVMSRKSVINNVEANISLFSLITNGLDEIQDDYNGELLKNSYFSQSQSFPDAAQISGLTLAFLIKSAFDLAVEKRITLTKSENPVMIALKEYGGPGENDENINLFYDSNELTGQETYLLPAGKTVVVYI